MTRKATGPSNYWSPYVAGAVLGLTLLATFFIMGRGLGVSSAVTKLTAYALAVPFPSWVENNPYLKAFTGGFFRDWYVIEVAGLLVGALIGSITARRFKLKVEKGPQIGPQKRFVAAFTGGAMLGFATRLARGCTSGVALSGGAALVLGAWAFMIGMFGGGFAIAYFARRLWR